MSILIIRKSKTATQSADAIPRAVVSQLVERAGEAGLALAIRSCSSEQEMIESIARASEQRAAFVLLDPGSAACCSDRFRAALERLEVPFIEVHDDRAGALEHAGIHTDGGAQREALVQGYGAQSYVLALAIALERLGCAECGNNYHVGT